jgi:hypothetical protein
MCDDTTERSGQASDKPRGRKPRDALALLGLWGYGDLGVCDRVLGRDLAMRVHGDGTVTCNPGTTIADSC